jgi:hypothetical protein
MRTPTQQKVIRMGQKLEGNGMWESSRMMLPEHKERIIADNFEMQYKRLAKPTLDDQEWEEIMRVLMESLGMRVPAKFTIYHEYGDCAAIGIVEKVDPYTRIFLIDGEWFKMADIVGVQLE